MEMAIALVVVGLIGYFPARKVAKAALIEAQAARQQTATSNGISMGAMVEAMYHRQARIETALNNHIDSPNPHGWDPDYITDSID